MSSLRLFSSDSEPVTPVTNTSPYPNPWKFKILRTYVTKKFVLYELQYENCSNFEGKKICLVRSEVKILEKFDPHFIEQNGLFARFEPTEAGWIAGMVFAEMLSSVKTPIL